MDSTVIFPIIGYVLGGIASLYALGQAIDFFKKKRKEHRDAIAQEALEESQEDTTIRDIQADIKSLKAEDCSIHRKIDKILAEQDIVREQFIIETHSWMYRMWFECKKRGFVTSMDLQTIEERYVLYKKRGGNSYVDDLVKEIRGMTKKDLF